MQQTDGLRVCLACSEGSRRFDGQVSLVTGQLMSEVYDAGVLADVQQAQRIVATCLTAHSFKGLLHNVRRSYASAYGYHEHESICVHAFVRCVTMKQSPVYQVPPAGVCPKIACTIGMPWCHMCHCAVVYFEPAVVT